MTQFLKGPFPLLPKSKSIEESFNAGLSCSLNGANTNNCGIAHFATRENRDAWEEGKIVGEERKEIEERTIDAIPDRVCRQCGCHDYDACDHPEFGPCWWVEEDLCSHCKFWPGKCKRHSQIKK